MAELTATIKELNKERETIMEFAANFGSFLKHNAMVPYNDAFNDYIDMLIQDEQNKAEHADKKKIERLLNDKKVYENNKEVLIKALDESKGTKIKIEDIFKMRDNLVGLKHNGNALRDAMGN